MCGEQIKKMKTLEQKYKDELTMGLIGMLFIVFGIIVIFVIGLFI